MRILRTAHSEQGLGQEKVAAMRRRRTRWIVLFCTAGIALLVLAVGVLQQGTPYDAKRPPTDAEPGRWVWLEGAENTRDIGGYKTLDGRVVRRGLVYRSGTLSHVTDAGCKAFRDLGVVAVIDFRSRLSPLPLFNGDVLGIQRAATVYGCPVSLTHQQRWQDEYLCGFRDNVDSFRRAFELLANRDNLPLMYHCQIGVERTGIMTALLLMLLGVDRETVLADFRLCEKIDLAGNLLAMNRLLDEVEARGGIERFLAEAGISPAVQTQIRDLLLEK